VPRTDLTCDDSCCGSCGREAYPVYVPRTRPLDPRVHRSPRTWLAPLRRYASSRRHRPYWLTVS